MLKVIIGGSWLDDSADYFRGAYRYRYGPADRLDVLSFRPITTCNGTKERKMNIETTAIATPLLDAYKAEMCKVTDAYSIGKTPVTVGMWREYCEATGKEMPAAPSWGWIEDHPIVNVNYFECMEYAKWAGLDLPTAEEWEYAAAGPNKNVYPWGNEWDATKCCNFTNSNWQTAAVNTFQQGASWCGAVHMAGNVWEWTKTNS